jgi:ankyrin repeat protein
MERVRLAGEEAQRARKDRATRRAEDANARLRAEEEARLRLVAEKAATELHDAVAKHNWEHFEKLLATGPDVNKGGEHYHGQTPLSIATQHGHESMVERLLATGADVNKPDHFGWTPLLVAARYANADLVEQLLEVGADLDEASTDGRTPLWVAAAHCREEILRRLIEVGANADTADDKGRTPLYKAAEHGYEGVVQQLLAAGADLDTAANDGRTPLCMSVANSREGTVGLLAAAGADLDKTGAHPGATPLSIAAQLGHEGIFRRLLEAGADAEKVNDHGVAPLYRAAEHGHGGIVELLVKAGATVDQQTFSQKTPLHIAALNGHLLVVEWLLAMGASTEKAIVEGVGPLYWAAYGGKAGTVEKLLAAGADMDQTDMKGRTPLSVASCQNTAMSCDVVQLLLSAGADLTLADNAGETPLFKAAAKGCELTVTMLLAALDSAGCMAKRQALDQENDAGWTPLSIAVQAGHENVAICLLAMGSDLRKAGAEGQTLLCIAAQGSRQTMVELLLAAGSDLDKTPRQLISRAIEQGVFLGREVDGLMSESGEDQLLPIRTSYGSEIVAAKAAVAEMVTSLGALKAEKVKAERETTYVMLEAAEDLADMLQTDAFSEKDGRWQSIMLAKACAKWLELDEDQSKSLDPAELVPLCTWIFDQFCRKFDSEKAKQSALEKQVEYFLSRHENGQPISFDEFLGYFQEILADVELFHTQRNQAYADGYDQSEAANKFRQLDKDENGFLDGDELEALVAWVHEQFRPGGKPMVMPESRCSLRIHVRYSSTNMACPPPPCAVGQGAGARGGAASAPAGRGRGRRGWEAVFLRVRWLLSGPARGS